MYISKMKVNDYIHSACILHTWETISMRIAYNIKFYAMQSCIYIYIYIYIYTYTYTLLTYTVSGFFFQATGNCQRTNIC